MTPEQIDIALALGHVSTGLGSSMAFAVKTFTLMAEDQQAGAQRELSILQEEYLYLLAVRYRRQLSSALVAIARKQMAIIAPLVADERATRKREADDRKAQRLAVERAKLRGQRSIADLFGDLTL